MITAAVAQDCSKSPYCKSIRSCKEALYLLEVCGLTRLDRDKDGIPCEAVCGKRLTPILKAMKNSLKNQKPNSALGFISTPSATMKCGAKKYCREMISCEEAKFHMNKCGLKTLDGDHDGLPCNKLCK